MQNELIDLYKDVLNDLGYTVSPDGFVMVKTDNPKEKIMVTVNSKTLVLPYKDQLRTMTTVDGSGKVTTTKILFNPLKEDAVKGESPSLRKIKEAMDLQLSFKISTCIELLLRLAGDKGLQSKITLEQSKFIASLGSIRTTPKQEIVDDLVISKWQKISHHAMGLTPSKGIAHLYTKKGGVKDGNKYNRLITFSMPIYKLLLEEESKKSIFDMKVRAKDSKIYRAVIEHMFPDINNAKAYSFGSSDPDFAGFIASFTIYIAMNETVQAILKDLAFIDPDTVNLAITESKVTLDRLEKLNDLKGLLAVIPNDLDSNREVAKPTPASKPAVNPKDILYNQQQAAPQQQYVEPANSNNNTEAPRNESLAKRILYGNGQPPIQQQQMMPQPMNQQMGIPNMMNQNPMGNQMMNPNMANQSQMMNPAMPQNPMMNQQVGYPQQQMMNQNPMGNQMMNPGMSLNRVW